MLKRLLKPLQVADAKEITSGDPRFEALAALVLDGQYIEAMRQAEALIEADITDVRVIAYYLFGLFVDRGVGALPDILEALLLLLTQSWDALVPADKRERHALSSFTWLLQETSERLRRVESEGGDVWQRWVNETSADVPARVLSLAPALREALDPLEPSDEGAGHTALYSVEAWLAAFAPVVAADGVPSPEAANQGAPAAEVDGPPEVRPPLWKSPSPPPSEAKPASETRSNLPLIQGSPALAQLIEHLQAFEVLIAREDYERAAIIVDDIHNVIETFDARVYFPSLFAPLYRGLQGCIDEIGAQLQEKGSYRWSMLEQLYRVDLKAFAEGE